MDRRRQKPFVDEIPASIGLTNTSPVTGQENIFFEFTEETGNG